MDSIHQVRLVSLREGALQIVDISKQKRLGPNHSAEDEGQWESLWGLDSKLLDLLPVGVYFCDADGFLIRWNRYATDLWGREPRGGKDTERFCGSHRLYHVDGELMENGDCPMAEALRTGQPQRIPEVLIERPDGSRRVVDVTIDPLWDGSGTLIGAVNVFQDITEKKQAQQERLQIEKRFFQLLEKLPAAAYTCDTEGLITYFNDHAEKLWGRSPKLKNPVDRFCGSFRLFAPTGSPIPHDRCWMALALRSRHSYQAEEIVIERPDGSRRTALTYATPFHVKAGDLAGAVNVLIDITEQKQAQDRISKLLFREKEQSQKLREADRQKDEFLAMLAHELRNPLAPIRSGLDILAMECGEEQDVVRLMQEQVEHLVRLVDDLMDVSRIMRGRIELRMEPVEVVTLVERSVNAVRPLIDENQQELTVCLPEQPLWLDGDPVRLVQVLENLLTNASKYTDAGGRIELTVKCEDRQVVLRVRDTGVGIDTELLPKVFDLFTQSTRSLERAKGGLGIGLTLVKSLVEMHEGEVSVQSDGPGQGTTFTVRLRTVDPPDEPQEGSKVTPVVTARRILVVDDNQGAAWLLSKLLEKLADHEIHIAYDGPSALAQVKEIHPEIVLLDIGLPEMNGFEVGRAIRERPEFDDILLIALTGYGREEDRIKSKEAGFDEHLVKPPSLDQMKTILSHPKLPSRTRPTNSGDAVSLPSTSNS